MVIMMMMLMMHHDGDNDFDDKVDCGDDGEPASINMIVMMIRWTMMVPAMMHMMIHTMLGVMVIITYEPQVL